MTRTTHLLAVAAAAVVLTSAAPVLADSQLISSAGLTPEQAAGMSLTEIAQHKFNRDESGADRWTVVEPGSGPADHSQLAASAGVSSYDAATMPLGELAAVKFNRDTREGDWQTVPSAPGAVVATRSVGEASDAFVQLIASAGLSPSQAKGMSLAEIAEYKFDRDASGADRQHK